MPAPRVSNQNQTRLNASIVASIPNPVLTFAGARGAPPPVILVSRLLGSFPRLAAAAPTAARTMPLNREASEGVSRSSLLGSELISTRAHTPHSLFMKCE